MTFVSRTRSVNAKGKHIEIPGLTFAVSKYSFERASILLLQAVVLSSWKPKLP